MPALLTTMSMPPNSRTVKSMASCTGWSSVRFTTMPMAADLLHDLGDVLVDVETDDLRALLGERFRDGEANAGRATGDERDFALMHLAGGAFAELGLFEIPVFDVKDVLLAAAEPSRRCAHRVTVQAVRSAMSATMLASFNVSPKLTMPLPGHTRSAGRDRASSGGGVRLK
jgi:hypothetical protein